MESTSQLTLMRETVYEIEGKSVNVKLLMMENTLNTKTTGNGDTVFCFSSAREDSTKSVRWTRAVDSDRLTMWHLFSVFDSPGSRDPLSSWLIV